MVEFMVDMGHESLNGAQAKTLESAKRANVLSRAGKVIEILKQPSLELLYQIHKRPFPLNDGDQTTLRIFYAGRLCFIDRTSASRFVRVELDEVLQGDRENREQTARRLENEIGFVRNCTPTPLSKMPLHLDPLSVMGITGEDKRRFVESLRSS